MIGYEAGSNETGSNKLYIENSNSATPLIWGDFANDIVTVHGNIGIGTTAPVSALDVDGDLRLAQMTAPNPTADKLYNVGGTLTWNGSPLATGGSISGNTGYISKFTSSSAVGDSIMFESSGKIGIGSTSPAQTLDVNGIIYSHSTVKADTSIQLGSSNVLSYGTNLLKLGENSYWDNVDFYSNGQQKMRLDINGNVGIGTTAPVHILDVQGGNVAVETAKKVVLDSDDTGDSYWAHDSANDRVSLFVDGIEMLRINE